jgi:hypothetical protein
MPADGRTPRSLFVTIRPTDAGARLRVAFAGGAHGEWALEPAPGNRRVTARTLDAAEAFARRGGARDTQVQRIRSVARREGYDV